MCDEGTDVDNLVFAGLNNGQVCKIVEKLKNVWPSKKLWLG